MKNHFTYLLLATLAVGLATSPLVMAADKPGASQADKDGAKEIQQAITALQKDYQTFETDPAGTILTACEYFKKNPAPDVTEAMIIKALDANYGNDAPTDAYVKWQLLSAVTGKFDQSLSAQATAIYARAAGGALLSHPGLDHRPLEIAASRLNSNNGEAQASQMNDQMDAAVTKISRLNHPIFEYRDRLFDTLPPTQEVCLAGLQDIINRMNHGASPTEVNGIFNKVRSAIIDWAGDAKPPQLQAMSNTLKKFANVVKNPVLTPYIKIAKDTTTKAYHWGGAPVLGPDNFTNIAAILDKDIATPPDQLGFKKDEK